MSLDSTLPQAPAAVAAHKVPGGNMQVIAASGALRSAGGPQSLFYKASDDSTLIVSVGFQGWWTGSANTTLLHAMIDDTSYEVMKRWNNIGSNALCMTGVREVNGVDAGWHTIELFISGVGTTVTLKFGRTTEDDYLSISVLEVDKP